MSKRKHHFVPKFYLRLFGTSDTQINLIHIPSRRLVQGAALKDQCYRRKFYGSTDEVEDALSLLEGDAATVIRRVVATNCVPAQGSADYHILMYFVLIQLQRTAKRSAEMDAMFRGMYHGIAESDPLFAKTSLSGLIDTSHTPLSLLRHTDALVAETNDLRLHLVCASEGQAFITSDHPVFAYNQHYEGVRGLGSLGIGNRGLQIVFPLSPKHLLLIYDPVVYKIDSAPSAVTTNITQDDLRQLNLMQIVGSDETLYFTAWSDAHALMQLIAKASGYRQQPRTLVQIMEEINSNNSNTTPSQGRASQVAFMQQVMPNLNLRLSFLSVLRKARRVSIDEKLLPTYRFRNYQAFHAEEEARLRAIYGPLRTLMKPTSRVFKVRKTLLS